MLRQEKTVSLRVAVVEDQLTSLQLVRKRQKEET